MAPKIPTNMYSTKKIKHALPFMKKLQVGRKIRLAPYYPASFFFRISFTCAGFALPLDAFIA